MIIGFGADLCDIRRIADALERYGERFPRRLFTPAEREYCDAKTARAASYAKRFAAKEACAKALGVGISHGVGWLDMGVVNLPSGMPTLELTGGAAARLRRDHPARDGRAGSPDLDRRGAIRAGDGSHRGGAVLERGAAESDAGAIDSAQL